MPSPTDNTSSRSSNPTGARAETPAHWNAQERAETARSRGGMPGGRSPFAMLPDLKLIAQHDGGWSSQLVDTLALLIAPIPAADWRSGIPVNFRPLKAIAFELGKTPRALRNHLNRLMHLGAIAFRDSANYRRYPRAGNDEEPGTVYGIDLAPAILLAEEAHARAQEIRAELRLHTRLHRHASALRRQIRAILFDPTHRDTLGNTTAAIKAELEALDLGRLDRLARTLLEHIVDRLSELLTKCRQLLEAIMDPEDNAVDNQKKPVRSDNDSFRPAGTQLPPNTYTTKSVPPYSCSPKGHDHNDDPSLAQLVEALPPDLASLVPPDKRIAGTVEFEDLVRAGCAYRPRLEISPDAWREAHGLIGSARATIVLVITAARYAKTWPEERRVHNPGAFFRALSRIAAAGKADLRASIHGIVAYHLAPRTHQRGG